MTHLTEEARGLQPQPLAAAQELAEADPGAASLARYLHGKGGGFSVYRNTEVTYFPGGEAKFEELLRQLEKAEKYIFLEYFIIDEGLMWGKILEVLARKAAEGVDVRVMYDGTCEFTTLPRDYPAASKSWASSAGCSRRCSPLSRPIIITATTGKFSSLTARWALPAA